MRKLLILGIVCVLLGGCTNNKSGTGKNDVAISNIENMSEEEQEDMNVDQQDISTYPLSNAMSDWYDGAGNLVWSGVSQEELNKFSKEQKENFTQWWEDYIESDYDTDSNEKLTITGNMKPRDRINMICREYNNLIPFAVGGREYGLGYEKYYEGFDNRTWEREFGTTFGLDGEGYLIWIYRNTFGETPAAMEDGLIQMLGRDDVESIEISDLMIGDICMLSDDPNASYNQYGIVAGEYNGHVVVSLCDNVSTPKFSDGSNRLAYIVDEYNVAIGESMPVEFKYFYRISSLDWGEQ